MRTVTLMRMRMGLGMRTVTELVKLTVMMVKVTGLVMRMETLVELVLVLLVVTGLVIAMVKAMGPVAMMVMGLGLLELVLAMLALPVPTAPGCPQVSATGSVLLSEVVGTIKLKVFLSGMPELRLGLNDRVLFELTGRECPGCVVGGGSGTARAQPPPLTPHPQPPPGHPPSPGGKNKSVELEDVKFHQCVRLSRFDNDRTISFIPPDGDFELMSYRLHTQVTAGAGGGRGGRRGRGGDASPSPSR